MYIDKSNIFRIMNDDDGKLIQFDSQSKEFGIIELDVPKFEDVADCLKKTSIQIRCRNCLMDIVTVVEHNKCCDGKTWAMLCGCIGSCYGIYLILSGKNGFKEYTHFCPSCHTVVGIYKPKPSTKLKIILTLFILIIIALKIIGFIFIVFPKLENKSK